MKRIITAVCLIIFLLTLSFSTIAEEIDFSTMTTDELLELRIKLNSELLSRPDSEGIILMPDDYLVGKDIMPGVYYARHESGTWSGGNADVYSDETKNRKDGKYISNRLDADAGNVCILRLEEGNVLSITNNNIIINKTGFPEYQIPDGVLIPEGVYEIGVEIPAGKYSAYWAGDSESCIYVYKDKESFEGSNISIIYSSLTYHSDRTNLELIDGNILEIKFDSIYMKKGPLTFSFE